MTCGSSQNSFHFKVPFWLRLFARPSNAVTRRYLKPYRPLSVKSSLPMSKRAGNGEHLPRVANLRGQKLRFRR